MFACTCRSMSNVLLVGLLHSVRDGPLECLRLAQLFGLKHLDYVSLNNLWHCNTLPRRRQSNSLFWRGMLQRILLMVSTFRLDIWHETNFQGSKLHISLLYTNVYQITSLWTIKLSFTFSYPSATSQFAVAMAAGSALEMGRCCCPWTADSHGKLRNAGG